MRKSIIFIIVVVILIGGALLILEMAPKKPSTQQDTATSQSPKSETDTPSAGRIMIKNNMFTPSQITVAKGGTVVWTNNDTTAHTVTTDQGDGPKSEEIQPGGLYEYTFRETGSYQYHCNIHPSMRGTIVVK